MADHYSILGVSRQATPAEIKAAFRKLAKQYHPDKNPHNPNAKELFNAIVRAYETLTDPGKKKRYDLYHGDISMQPKRQQGRKQKEWTFTDEDLRKRQYYQQYYKQKQKSSASATTKSKPYNDYKYVLYATPIAVCLLMLIISLFTSRPETGALPAANTPTKPATTSPKAHTGDRVYEGYFGPVKTAGTGNKLSVSNACGYDAVVALFDSKTNTAIQHAYVENGYYVEFLSLPESGVYLRCLIGKTWDPTKVVFGDKVQGCFDSIVQIQNWKKVPVVFNKHTGLEMVSLVVEKPDGQSGIELGNDSLFFRK